MSEEWKRSVVDGAANLQEHEKSFILDLLNDKFDEVNGKLQNGSTCPILRILNKAIDKLPPLDEDIVVTRNLDVPFNMHDVCESQGYLSTSLSPDREVTQHTLRILVPKGNRVFYLPETDEVILKHGVKLQPLDHHVIEDANVYDTIVS